MAEFSNAGLPKTNKSGRGQSRSRTFTGCRTCRIRHLKCDEKTPTCTPCERLKLPCQGYTPRLLWLQSPTTNEGMDDKSSEANSFRYPLFSEAQRKSMTVAIVQSLGNQSTRDILLGLDNEPVPDSYVHSVGPFGVFKATPNTSFHTEQLQRTTQTSHEERSENEEPASFEQNAPNFDHLLPPSSNLLSDSLFSFHSLYPNTDIFDMGTSGTTEWMSTVEGVRQAWDDFSQTVSTDLFDVDMRLPDQSSNEIAPGSSICATEPMQTSAMQRDTDLPTIHSDMPNFGNNTRRQSSPVLAHLMAPSNGNFSGGVSVLPPHTADLLQYLKAELLEKSPSSNLRRMSPWKMLLLPCALETVAELSLWNTTSHVRRSILSILLAKSAFHLSQSDTQDESANRYWLKIGTNHQRVAEEHLNLACRDELDGNAKYIEMLMAILGVGVISFNFKGPQAIKKQLLVAERLIRCHGFPATKTIQHRVLHHLYTHLRLVIESTNILPNVLEYEPNAESDSSTQLILPTTQRSFSIDLQKLGDLDLTRPKSDCIGYNDIHLDISGTWHATLYPEIFGLPETLMTLLSQTISLAKEKPLLEASAVADSAVSLALNKHIKILEQQIWSWNLPSGPRLASSMLHRSSSIYDQPLMENMVLALHQALIIFFYRRVYNVNVMIVQTQVRKTLDLLEPLLEMKGLDSDFGVSMGWPTFIAVCEAATPELQELGLKYLETVDDYGMFIEHGKPSTMVRAVWKRREHLNDFTFGWPDMMQLGTSKIQ